MRFTINTKNFLQALEQVAVIAAATENSHCDGFDQVHVSAKKKGLTLAAQSCFAAITTSLASTDDYFCDTVGSATVNARELVKHVASFIGSETIDVGLCSGVLTVSDSLDPENSSELLAVKNQMYVVPNPKDFEHSVTTDRALFVGGLRRVSFAMGNSDLQAHYMALFFEARKNTLRFVAGSGALFAVLDVQKQNVSNATQGTSIVFPRCGISPSIKVLNKCDSDLITIEYARASEEENTPAMILIRSGATTLFLFKIDTEGKCPDVNMFLKNRYPYQITTTLADWEQPVAAISANVSDGDGIHNTIVTANLRKGYFTLTTNRQATVKRTVPFVLGTFEYDRAQNTDCPWFCSNTVFVREFVKKGGKNDKVVMHFENQAQPEGHDSSTEGKRIKPILVAYPKVHKADGLVEQFHIFFIASYL